MDKDTKKKAAAFDKIAEAMKGYVSDPYDLLANIKQIVNETTPDRRSLKERMADEGIEF